MQRNHYVDDNTFGPAAPLLAFGLLLTGIGTAFLGPILPVLAHAWQLTDQQSGLLIAAKFFGAFLGGLSVQRVLRYGVLSGLLLAALGYTGFALSSGIVLGTFGLFVSGYGVGLSLTSINILVGRRYTNHTGSALSTINFFWSLGAVACGFLAALIVPRYGLHDPMLIYGGLFFATALAGVWLTSRGSSVADAEGHPASPHAEPLPRITHLYFAAHLFFYGGLETCMTAWLTTYSLRFTDVHLFGDQSAVVLLWTALTVGRVVASVAMRRISETAAQRIGLALSAIFIFAIATTQHSSLLSLYCVLLGLSLAPFFPSTFGILMRRRPTARQAGTVIAVSGLGAAIFPWMMGYISTQTSSLRVAMLVPMGLALVLLGLSLMRVPGGDPEFSGDEVAA
jgi:FHS family glucose/mannose:H+ symporter-like MFS transporter